MHDLCGSCELAKHFYVAQVLKCSNHPTLICISYLFTNKKQRPTRRVEKKVFGRLFLSDFFSRSRSFLHDFWILECMFVIRQPAPWPSLSSLSSLSSSAAASKTSTRRTKTTTAKWLLFYQKLKILRVRCILFLRRARSLTQTLTHGTVEGECNEVYCCQTRFSDSYQHQPGNIMCIYKLDFLSRVLARAWESCSFCEIAKNSVLRSQLVSQMRDELNRRRGLLVRMNSWSFFLLFFFFSFTLLSFLFARNAMPTN